MEKCKIGNIVKTKDGDKCIVVDFIDDEVLVFNLSKMHPDKVKPSDIVEKIQEPDGMTIIIDKKNHDNKEEKESETTTEETDEEIEKKFAELIKTFGKAAIELGEIFVKIAEGDADE